MGRHGIQRGSDLFVHSGGLILLIIKQQLTYPCIRYFIITWQRRRLQVHRVGALCQLPLKMSSP